MCNGYRPLESGYLAAACGQNLGIRLTEWGVLLDKWPLGLTLINTCVLSIFLALLLQYYYFFLCHSLLCFCLFSRLYFSFVILYLHGIRQFSL